MAKKIKDYINWELIVGAIVLTLICNVFGVIFYLIVEKILI